MDEDREPSKNADALIEALSTEGIVDSVGAFTVDSARARELLERFRLADPPSFVLSLLQIAVLGGASRLEAEITAAQVSLSFDGEPFALEDLTQALDALLAPPGVPRDPRRIALGEGLLGAEALSPRGVTLVSGGPDGGVTMERRPGQPDAFSRQKDTPPGIRITVERRSAPPSGAAAGWEPPEAERLISRGRFAPLELVVNGRRTGEGPTLPGAAFRTPVTGPGVEGMAGIEAKGGPATWFVVQSGAVVFEAPLDAAPEGFIAVVDAPAVRRDLSLAQVIKDEAWEKARQSVEAARDALLEKTRRYLAFPKLRDTEDLVDLARRTIRTAWLHGAFPKERLIVDLAVWPILGRSASGEQISLAALKSRVRRKKPIGFVTLEHDTIPPAARRILAARRCILRLPSLEQGALLGDRLSVRVRNLDSTVATLGADFPESITTRILGVFGLPGLLALLALVASLSVTAYFYSTNRDRERWPGVAIGVLEARWTRNVSRKNSKKVEFQVHAKLSYQVGGVTHQREEDRLKAHGSQAEAEAHIVRLKDPSYRIYYNPKDPTQVLHERESSRSVLWIGGPVIFAMAVVFLVLLVLGRRRQRAEADKHSLAQAIKVEEEMARRLMPPPSTRRKKRRRR